MVKSLIKYINMTILSLITCVDHYQVHVTAVVMSIPTATDGKQDTLGQEVELVKYQCRLKYLELIQEGKINFADTAHIDHLPTFPAGAPLPAEVPVATGKDIQIVAEPAESVSQNQPFEEWLKEVRMFLCQPAE